MAPVAGSPPNSGDTMFAIPWATSSTLGWCRSPLIRSATVADSNDSIAPSMATVSAGASSTCTRSGRNRGITTAGKPRSRTPNRDPMVGTSSSSAIVAAVASTRATMGAGTRGANRGRITSTASEPSPRAVAIGEIVGSARAASISRGRNTPLGCAKSSPRKSLIWVLAISTAMPLVNPITTGRGMYRTADPSPVTPSSRIITPAIIVHMSRPSTPKRATIPDTTITNAPVGPPIWTREPPSAEIRKPAATAVYTPACGGIPDEMANAIASGSATRPTVTPAIRS